MAQQTATDALVPWTTHFSLASSSPGTSNKAVGCTQPGAARPIDMLCHQAASRHGGGRGPPASPRATGALAQPPLLPAWHQPLGFRAAASRARDPNSQARAPSPCTQRVSCQLRHFYYAERSLSSFKGNVSRQSRGGRHMVSLPVPSDAKEDNDILPDPTRLFSSRSCKHPGVPIPPRASWLVQPAWSGIQSTSPASQS